MMKGEYISHGSRAMSLNLSRISMLTLAVFLPACFRFSPSIEATDSLKLAKASKENRDQYCAALSSGYNKKPKISQLPEFLLDYGDCLATERSATSENIDTAKSIYTSAARCGNAQAKVRLQSLNMPIPDEDGSKVGETAWIDFSDERCG